MTNDEAIEILKGAIKKPNTKDGYLGQALDMAIEALKQETCDDCISRQAVLDILDNHKYSKEFCEEHHIDWSINLGMAHIVINDLPSVTSKQKTGKWVGIEYDGYADGNPVYDVFECSVCGCEHKGESDTLTNYCPDCGAKMEAENETDY